MLPSVSTRTEAHPTRISNKLFTRTAKFAIVPLITPVLLLGALLLDLSPWTTIAVVTLVAGGLFPVLDLAFGKWPLLPMNEIERVRQERKKDPEAPLRAVWTLVLGISLQVVLVGIGLYRISRPDSQPVDFLYAALIGFTATPSYTHELYHCRKSPWTWVAKLHLFVTFFLHDERNHMLKHHNMSKSCLPDDPSVSRRGETVYSYFFRWQVGTFLDMWRYFAQLRVAKGGKPYTLHNYMVRLVLGYAVFLGATASIFGLRGLAFVFIHAVVTQTVFAITTYSQHYGLVRLQKVDGTFEPFSVLNVWSINSRFFSWESFSVEMHAHHHLDPSAPYYELVHIEGSPIVPIPGGFYGMMAAIIVSPVWFHYVNPVVDQIVERRKSMLESGKEPRRAEAFDEQNGMTVAANLA